MILTCSGACGQTFPAPFVDGQHLVSTETLTIVRKTDGTSIAVGVCDTCSEGLLPPSLRGL